MLHHGSGELQTITGVELVRSHRAAREDPYRLGVALVGLEAMLRLFPEQEQNARAFEALTRFLDVADELPSRAPARPALDPLALAFQLKLLWLSGYQPHLESCAECGAEPPLVGLPAAGGRRASAGLVRERLDRAVAGRVRRDRAPAARARSPRRAMPA